MPRTAQHARGIVADGASAHTCVAAIEARVRAQPGAAAVHCESIGERSLADVNAAANRLAHDLLDQGKAGADEPVAVLAERSSWTVISALGVLKAGACFFPVAPELPDERIALLLGDSGCRAAVASSEAHDRLRELAGRPLRLVDPARLGGPQANPASRARPGDAAALIYTSGSTGRPKGVVIEHRSLTNLIDALQPMLYEPLGGRSREALSAPLMFDAALQQMLSCLANGGTLFVVDAETRRDPRQFIACIERHQVRTINVVASFLGALVEAGLGEHIPGSLSHIVTGGEAVPAEMIRRLFAAPAAGQLTLFSMYGPTETCVDATCCRINRDTPIDWPHAPLGEAVANMTVDVRNRELAVCGPDEIGEICIAGAGVARGYLHPADVGGGAFVSVPGVHGGRLYRTGDLGRVRADGTLEWLGRADDQIKVRGHRVELGEIEIALARHRDVRQVAVIAVDAGDGAKDLVAYAAAPPTVTAEALRAVAAGHLPSWMVPSRYEVVRELPHTHNGKLDRRALVARWGSDSSQLSSAGRREEFETPVEAELAAVMGEVLGLAHVARDGDFFALGGHSLKAMQIVNRIADRFDAVVPVHFVFEHPSPASLSEAITPLLVGAAPVTRDQAIPRLARQPDYSLSSPQRRLWTVQQLDGAGAAYNVPVVMAQGRLHRPAVEAALAAIAARHDCMRASFHIIDREPRMRVADTTAVPLRWLDLSGEPDPAATAPRIVREDAGRPFDLAAAPLARATVLKLAPAASWFVLTINHLVCDGWSITILTRELNEAYRAARAGRAPVLPALPIRYVDFADWDRRRERSRSLEHWLDRLHGVDPWLELPTDSDRDPAASGFSGRTRQRRLEGSLSGDLRRLASERRTTLAAVILALYAWLLHRLTRSEDICIGMGSAGRDHQDLEGVVGLFAEVLPVRLRLSADLEVSALLELVGAAMRDALDAGAVPLDELVRALSLTRRPDVQPLVNVMFAYQSFADLDATGQGDGELTLDQSRIVDVPLATSKFDLTLYVYESAAGLRLALEYDDRLFTEQTIDRYLISLERLAERFAEQAAR